MQLKTKILIIRLSSIGDIVLTTPVIRCLKLQIANLELHYVIKEKYKFILENNPYIDKIHLYKDNLSETIQKLKAEEFDHIIDLHHNFRSSKIKSILNVGSFTVNKINFAKWLIVNLKKNILPQVHIFDRYMDTTKVFDIKNDNQGLDYFIDKKDKINISEINPAFYQGFIAFAIGGQFQTKHLPKEKIFELCKLLNRPIILLGGREDFEDAEFACSKLKEIGHDNLIYNACGKYNFNQSAYLLSISKLVIAHDTGLMHVAAAYNKKIVSIWGNTIPEFGMYPYQTQSENIIIEVKNLRCRPCSKLGYKKCPKKHFKCMNMIDLNKINEFVKTHY